MNQARNSAFRSEAGLSLAEVMITLVIASMVMAAVLGVYLRMQRAIGAIQQRLDEDPIGRAVLQRLAEDLDAVHEQETVQITVENKTDHGYPVARLTIRQTYFDVEQQEQPLNTIVWQAAYDFESEQVVLYRKQEGLLPDDRLLDAKRPDVEALRPFVPVCGHLTMFTVEVPQGEQSPVLAWQDKRLPPGVRVKLSFAQPTVGPTGEFLYDPDTVLVRTIALDRTRKSNYQPEQTPEEDESTNTAIRLRRR